MGIFSFFKKRGPFDKIIKRFEKGKELKFDEYLKLGDYYREQGLYAKALRIHRSLEVKKDLTPFQRARLEKSLALDYLNLYQYREAVKYFIKADSFFKGEDEEIRRGLLKAYEFSGDWESAVELKKELLVLNKEYSEEKIAYYYLLAAEDLIKRGNKKKARKFIKEALKLKENLPEAFYFLAELESDPFKKLEYYEKIISRFPFITYRKLVSLKNEFFEKGKMDELLNFLNKSENTYLRAFMVPLLIQKGEYERAKSMIEGLRHENEEDIFLNLILLIPSVELNLEEEVKDITNKIERNLKELNFICTKCKKEYLNYRFRCENCGEVKTLVLKIKI